MKKKKHYLSKKNHDLKDFKPEASTSRHKDRLPCVPNKQELLRIIRESEDIRLVMLIFIGIFQGMRIGEILNQKWDDVDLEQGRMTARDCKNVNRYKTDYGRDRVVPIDNRFIHIYKKWKLMFPDEEYIIPLRFKDRARPNIKSLIRLFQDKLHKTLAKVNMLQVNYYQDDGKPRYKYHLHTLRHICGTNMRKMGVPIEDIQEFLGHSDVKSTRIYARLTLDELRNVVSRAYDLSLPKSNVRDAPTINVTLTKETLELQNEILEKKLLIKRMEMMERMGVEPCLTVTTKNTRMSL